MLKIKLAPLGKKDRKFYRIVVAEDRSKLQGQYMALLGTYDPHNPDNRLDIDRELYQSWVAKGAQPTETIKKLINKSK